jgi:hypothetical protein
LHNDNTGAVYGMVDGKKLNQAIETITINSSDRNFYELSLHGYRIPKSKGKTLVNVKVERVNPYSVIFNNDVEVYNAEETKVCSFQIDEKGNLEELNGNPELLNNLVTDIPNRL